ncbi:hypothetical protein BKK79_20340 [Cupriavidus sp. USMAA2-4]|uniref:Uncharacterized protein n=1 Tax=Cupriavidus malaysiensis TaxID=367825 RepID=A0ABM6FDJ0_9BURK|nr:MULTISPECIES: hypothetical protein [Cupriavidus]AOY94322.1 hypothetical protein BKK79_20340 [Cupriavidus sp. USMAA2-4]AOZ02763.1 hypothetical protein BKK81_26625 [Cupriavidus sp. USMAHM13]AOZ09863.1 hypothetical protein BKK80_29685 [Cupriavidus malaysiensis]
MPVITRSDLQYEYSWTPVNGDNPKLTGKPDDVLLNRKEGYEVLAFLVHFCRSWNDADGKPLTRAHALKAERLIHLHLPSDVRSRMDVSEWLADNWESYT